MANTFKLKSKNNIGVSTVGIYTVPASTTTVIIGVTAANISGQGINVGIGISRGTNGDDISLSFIIKPTSSIKTKGKTVNKEGNEVDIEVTGRHDPCVGIRAVPIAEAMVSLVLVDHLLMNKAKCADVEQNLPFSE